MTEICTPIPEQPKRQVAVQQTTPSTLLNLAVQQGADLDRLEKLFEMQVKWEANEARKAFAEAFAEFKAKETVYIHKDKFVSFSGQKGKTEYAHASIGNVVRTITEAISKYGFSHNWLVEQENGYVYVKCVLKHKLGHSEEVSLNSPVDSSGGKNAIQGIASAITYLQRYTLLSITGCATSDDDDGQAAGNDAAVNQAYNLAAALTDQFIARVKSAQSVDDLMQIWSSENAKLAAYPDLHDEFKAACTSQRQALRNPVAAPVAETGEQ